MKISSPLAYTAFILALFSLTASAATKEKLLFERTFAPRAKGIVEEIEKPYRQEIALNGRWDFQPVDLPSDFIRYEGNPPALPDPKSGSWDDIPIKIPSPWNINAFQQYPGVIDNTGDYEYYPSYPEKWEKVEMAWMRTEFEVPESWRGKDVMIHFEAVAGHCEVRVNGETLATHFNLNLPFDVPINEVANFGQPNELLVGVRRDTLFFDRGIGGYRVLPSNTFWGWEMAGIWQDVSLIAVPKTRISDIFVMPWVDEDRLELKIATSGPRKNEVDVTYKIYPWIAPKPNTDIIERAEQIGSLGVEPILSKGPLGKENGVEQPSFEASLPVEGRLQLWTPESPNLYGVVAELKIAGKTIDRKYVRFGWRQYGFDGIKFTLNGEPIRLHADAIHFMGIADMSRRQVLAYFQALKDMNVNLARATIQIRPRMYYEVADEFGMMVLGETGIWADYNITKEVVWERFRDESVRLVKRDRNHPSIVGWSLTNEFFASLAAQQAAQQFSSDVMVEAARKWEPIIKEVQALDPTRPWVSFDGDAPVWPAGTYRPPVEIGHYGDEARYLLYQSLFGDQGIPWGITESTEQYFRMPDYYEEYVGDRVYESVAARMEGVAWEIYDMLANLQYPLNNFMMAAYNATWYGLKALPLGQKDITRAPNREDGVWFGDYVEGQFGVQPERIGPYSTIFNPGYDPSLPVYDPWPSFFAQKAAYAPGGPAPYDAPKKQARPPLVEIQPEIEELVLLDGENPRLRPILEMAGVRTVSPEGPTPELLMIDLSSIDSTTLKELKPIWSAVLEKGGTVFLSAETGDLPEHILKLLPAPASLNERSSVSLIPNREIPILEGVHSADLFFGTPFGGGTPIMSAGIEGNFTEGGNVWLTAPEVDWRNWSITLPELQRTVSLLRGEREKKPSGVALVEFSSGNGRVFLCTILQQADSTKQLDLWRLVLNRLGVAMDRNQEARSKIIGEDGSILKALKIGPFFGSDYQKLFREEKIDLAEINPIEGHESKGKTWTPTFYEGPTRGFVLDPDGAGGPSTSYVSFWLYSPLANEIVENPKGSRIFMQIGCDDGFKLWVNGSLIAENPVGSMYQPQFELTKGWNHILLKITNAGGQSGTILKISSDNEILRELLQASVSAPESDEK